MLNLNSTSSFTITFTITLKQSFTTVLIYGLRTNPSMENGNKQFLDMVHISASKN